MKATRGETKKLNFVFVSFSCLRVCLCVFWYSVMTHGTAISPLYHFTLSDGTPLSAQTRCKFCCPPNPDVQPFIMGIHTIDRYCAGHVTHTNKHTSMYFSCTL